MMTVREFDVRPWVLGVSVLLSVMVCCTQATGQGLDDPQLTLQETVRLPCGIPFECVDAIRFRNAEVRWKLSFDPKRPGIYDIVHWRIAYYGRAGQDGPVERVAQITFPQGKMTHYRVFLHVKKRDWRRLWLTRRWDWQEFRHGTPAYRTAALDLARLFMVANKLRLGADPAEMEF